MSPEQKQAVAEHRAAIAEHEAGIRRIREAIEDRRQAIAAALALPRYMDVVQVDGRRLCGIRGVSIGDDGRVSFRYYQYRNSSMLRDKIDVYPNATPNTIQVIMRWDCEAREHVTVTEPAINILEINCDAIASRKPV